MDKNNKSLEKKLLCNVADTIDVKLNTTTKYVQLHVMIGKAGCSQQKSRSHDQRILIGL